VSNNGGLVFDLTDDITFSGVISGTGSLTQQGPNELTIGGANTFSGVTTINAGGSQPVKFSLDGFQGLGILDGAPTLLREDCTTHDPIDSPINASAGAPLAYDAATDWYKFTWKTLKAWAGWCGTFSLHLADDQSYEFAVAFTKS
jgi:autotransporter-associated beta strand protein